MPSHRTLSGQRRRQTCALRMWRRRLAGAKRPVKPRPQNLHVNKGGGGCFRRATQASERRKRPAPRFGCVARSRLPLATPRAMTKRTPGSVWRVRWVPLLICSKISTAVAPGRRLPGKRPRERMASSLRARAKTLGSAAARTVLAGGASHAQPQRHGHVCSGILPSCWCDSQFAGNSESIRDLAHQPEGRQRRGIMAPAPKPLRPIRIATSVATDDVGVVVSVLLAGNRYCCPATWPGGAEKRGQVEFEGSQLCSLVACNSCGSRLRARYTESGKPRQHRSRP